MALLALSATALSAQVWWDDKWTGRIQLSINTAAEAVAIGETLQEKPVLVRLHGGNFPFGEAAPDGNDLRFVSDDQETVLPYHVERFDDLLQEALVWIKVPVISGSAQTSVWLYYGQTSALQRTQSAPESYDSDTLLVYHFGERNAPARDISGNEHHAENAGIPVEGALIAGGLRLTGRNPVVIPSYDTLVWEEGQPLTIGVWVASESNGPNAAVFSRGNAGSGLEFGLNDGLPYLVVRRAGQTQRIDGSTAVPAGSWRHLAVVSTGSAVELYLNGESQGRIDAVLPTLQDASQLGAGRTEPGFAGQIDEFIVSGVARSSAWLRFAAINQGSSAAASELLSVMSGEAGGGAADGYFSKGGYFAVIMGSMNFDGWAIMILLGLMSLGSILIMIFKVIDLNTIGRSNRNFMRLWRQVSHDLTLLDNVESMESLGGNIMDAADLKRVRNAPVFRLYRTGVMEITHRLQSSGSGGLRLSGVSVQAIKAAMDGTFIRENQKLNALLVYLTISIAGGPFIGLLGTVFGVTITFAAIAAAGDVNINSIAPGISAALMTTIAGLGVAIPALFGYNYLVIRIKDTAMSMRIFNDEFVTKAAEFYSKKSAHLHQHDEDIQEDPGLINLTRGRPDRASSRSDSDSGKPQSGNDPEDSRQSLK